MNVCSGDRKGEGKKWVREGEWKEGRRTHSTVSQALGNLNSSVCRRRVGTKSLTQIASVAESTFTQARGKAQHVLKFPNQLYPLSGRIITHSCGKWWCILLCNWMMVLHESLLHELPRRPEEIALVEGTCCMLCWRAEYDSLPGWVWLKLTWSWVPSLKRACEREKPNIPSPRLVSAVGS